MYQWWWNLWCSWLSFQEKYFSQFLCLQRLLEASSRLQVQVLLDVSFLCLQDLLAGRISSIKRCFSLSCTMIRCRLATRRRCSSVCTLVSSSLCSCSAFFKLKHHGNHWLFPLKQIKWLTVVMWMGGHSLRFDILLECLSFKHYFCTCWRLESQHPWSLFITRAKAVN